MMIVGMSSRPAAISCPGVVLSQEARHTMPSSSAPFTATSMSEAIRSRDGRMYCPAAPGGGDRVGRRRGPHLERDAARVLDGPLQRRDDLVQVAEAGRELRRGVDDRDLRLLQVLVAQPERGPLRAAHRPRRGPWREVGAKLPVRHTTEPGPRRGAQQGGRTRRNVLLSHWTLRRDSVVPGPTGSPPGRSAPGTRPGPPAGAAVPGPRSHLRPRGHDAIDAAVPAASPITKHGPVTRAAGCAPWSSRRAPPPRTGSRRAARRRGRREG